MAQTQGDAKLLNGPPFLVSAGSRTTGLQNRGSNSSCSLWGVTHTTFCPTATKFGETSLPCSLCSSLHHLAYLSRQDSSVIFAGLIFASLIFVGISLAF